MTKVTGEIVMKPRCTLLVVQCKTWSRSKYFIQFHITTMLCS